MAALWSGLRPTCRGFIGQGSRSLHPRPHCVLSGREVLPSPASSAAFPRCLCSSPLQAGLSPKHKALLLVFCDFPVLCLGREVLMQRRGHWSVNTTLG